MNRQHRRFSFVPLAKRFALPALAAWLLHAGIWTLIFVLCQTIMAVLSNSVNCSLTSSLPEMARLLKPAGD